MADHSEFKFIAYVLTILSGLPVEYGRMVYLTELHSILRMIISWGLRTL